MASAQDAAPGSSAPDPAVVASDVDPAAVAILSEAIAPIAAAQAIEIRFRTTFDAVQEEGFKLQFTNQVRFRIKRPDRARTDRVRDDGRTREVRYDGETVSFFDPNENAYGRIPVPDNLDDTFDYLELEIGMPLPMADLLYADPLDPAELAVAAGVVGVSQVGEWTCDHLVFRGENVDWQVWVERADPRRLRKFLITYHDEPGAPQYTAVFDHWDLDAKLPDEIFEFMPPEASERIPVLAQPAGSGEER
jgi:hypothetical protein